MFKFSHTNMCGVSDVKKLTLFTLKEKLHSIQRIHGENKSKKLNSENYVIYLIISEYLWFCAKRREVDPLYNRKWSLYQGKGAV